MKSNLLFLLFSIIIITSCSKKQDIVTFHGKKISFNKDWLFSNQKQIKLDNVNTKAIEWDSINVPHDWTAKTPYSQAYKITDSTPPLGGIGWYKKQFNIKNEDKNKQISIEFDGIYNNSKVWINNHYLGFWPYGYTAFSYDLTPFLKFGEEDNEIIVQVDRNNFLDTRWYAGSGIYRDVKLVTKSKIHIPKWGIKIETPYVSKENSQITVDFQTVNSTMEESSLKVIHSIFDKSNNQVYSKEIQFQQKDSLLKQSINLEIDSPDIWSPKAPNLYKLNTKVYHFNTLVDEANTTFGVRSFRFDSNEGFFLNNKKTYIKGVCLHHAAGALGAAVPNEVWVTRLKQLKLGGVNAIRTAHNPASEAFLNICDSLGFLVQEEIFDELDYPKDKRRNYNGADKNKKYEQGYTNHFQKHWKNDLGSMLLRDQNHPSIFMWSIGNEIEWTYPRYSSSSGYFNSGKKYYYDEPPISIDEMKKRFVNNPPKKYELAKTVSKLSKFTKSIDTTRPVTANLVIPTIGHFSGYTDALDIVGYSYRACLYDYGHRHYPEKMLFGSENWANYIEWKSVLDNPHIPGIFLWTGIHYMGETKNIESRGSTSGLIYYSGKPTPRWHMFKSLWNEDPMVYATTYPLKDSDYKIKNSKVAFKQEDLWKKRRWGWQKFNYHWNYKKGEMIVVEVFTNCPEATLTLNGSKKGIEQLSDYEDHLIKFAVPFEAGELKVTGNCDKNIVDYSIKTAEESTTIKLSTNHSQVKTNSNTIIYLTVQLIDEKNTPITHIEDLIEFEIDEDLSFIGVENDDFKISTVSSTPRIKTFNGSALVYLKAGKEKGIKEITATLPDGTKSSIKITIN